MTTTISPSLTLYLNDIGNHELLSKADEVKLSERIRKGNAANRQRCSGSFSAVGFMEYLRGRIAHPCYRYDDSRCRSGEAGWG